MHVQFVIVSTAGGLQFRISTGCSHYIVVKRTKDCMLASLTYSTNGAKFIYRNSETSVLDFRLKQV